MTPWLETCRACVVDIRSALEGLPTRVEREPVLRRGEGGDDTTAIDEAAELAVAEGPAMRDVVFGYVYDFGTGEEWTATRGGGAFLDGVRLGGVKPKDPIEILSFEGTTTAAIAEHATAVAAVSTRLRVMGSLALSLCHLAAGRVDGVCSLKGARSVDIAAAQLLVRECGSAIELFEAPPFGDAPLDLVPRSRLAAAGTPALVEALAAALA